MDGTFVVVVFKGGKVAFRGLCTAQEDSRGLDAAHPLRYESLCLCRSLADKNWELYFIKNVE